MIAFPGEIVRIYMLLTELQTIGGIESSLIPLVKQLKTMGKEVLIYVIKRIPIPNQNLTELRAANIQIIQPSEFAYRAVQFGLAHKSFLVRFLLLISSPVLVLLAGLDRLVQNESYRKIFRSRIRNLERQFRRLLDFELYYYSRLRSSFRHKPPAIIHIHGWGCGEDPPGALRALSPLKFPIVFTEHNSPDPARLRPIPDAPMNLADVLIAVSQAGKSGLIEVGLAKRPIQVIPYGVHPVKVPMEKPRVARREFVITCLARFERQKRHGDLIEAMTHVILQLPDAKLLLAGKGSLWEKTRAQVSSCNLEKHVEFLGILHRLDFPDLFARTDVVVLASEWEGLPVALLEAMSAGKAIVATRAGGNPELVTDGENGLLMPIGDIPALGRALITLGQSDDLVRRMGECSRRKFELLGYTPHEAAKSTLEAYQLAVENRSSSKTGDDPARMLKTCH
jgi:glycosyltransferase involved in cell wall biosynthesis